MVYFTEVRKRGKKPYEKPNKAEIDEMFNTAIKVREFVANEKELNPYTELYESDSDKYAKGRQKETVEVMKVKGKFIVTPEQKKYIKRDLDEYGYSQRSAFQVPIECKGMKPYPKRDEHEVCMKKWKHKIDANIPEFQDYDVDLREEY